MIRAIIIDDEPAMQEVNSQLLSECFPSIEQVGTANSIKTGIDLIHKENPDLVLLDIQLSDGSGFQLLQKLPSYDFKVVFSIFGLPSPFLWGVIMGLLAFLPIIGIIPLSELLSVVIQVVFFKLTKGRRVFKMTPLHHHFELIGWSDTQIVQRFWLIGLVAGLVGIALSLV